MFAIDLKTEEILVSDSPKGSNQIILLERLPRSGNEILFHAVQTLTGLAQSEKFDVKIFKAMDKVCQMLYDATKSV